MSDIPMEDPPLQVIARLQSRMQPEMKLAGGNGALPVILWVDGEPEVMMVPALVEEVEGHTIFTLSPVSASPSDRFVQSDEDMEEWMEDRL